MNLEFFIAHKLVKGKESGKSLSKAVISLAIACISIGLIVMIVSIAIVTGFKSEIRNKVIGFGGHITIQDFTTSSVYETKPIDKNPEFLPELAKIEGIKHIQVFGSKAGIIKTKTDIQGVILKGVGSDFDWSFFKKNIIEGEAFTVNDSLKTDKILISAYIARKLKLKIGEKVRMFFISVGEKPKGRPFYVSGIYDTGLEEFDKNYIIADIGYIRDLNNWDANQISGFELLINDFDNLDRISRDVFMLIGYSFDNEGNALRVQDIKQLNPQIFEWLNLVDTNVVVILVIMIIVAGFSMVSGLLILILERTNMIGILKALGMEDRSIGKIFIFQAIYLTIKGLVWGNLLGIAICLVQKFYGIIKLDAASYYVSTVPINLKISYLLMLNVGTLFIIFLMLLVPSLVISGISPVKSIKYE